MKKSRLAIVVCGLGALFYCYEYFLRITPSVMMHELMQFHQIDGASFGILSALYYWAYDPMQIPVGLLIDRFGPRRLLIGAAISCALGSLLFANQSLYIAGSGRFLVGFGSAFAFVGALKLANQWLPREQFGFFSGIIMTIGMLGAISGEVSLTGLVRLVGWQHAVIFSAAFGVLLVVLLYLYVKDSPHTKRHQRTQHTIDFVRAIRGLFDLFRDRSVLINGTIGGLAYLPASAFAELWGTPYLETAHHLTKHAASWADSMVFLGLAIGAPLAGWLSDYFRNRVRVMQCGMLGSLSLITIILFAPPMPSWLIFALLVGFGICSGVQILVFAIARDMSSSKNVGTAMAVTNMLVMISGAIFQPLVGYILDISWHGPFVNGERIFSTWDYRIALSCLPIGLTIAFILTFFLKHKVKK